MAKHRSKRNQENVHVDPELSTAKLETQTANSARGQTPLAEIMQVSSASARKLQLCKVARSVGAGDGPGVDPDPEETDSHSNLGECM